MAGGALFALCGILGTLQYRWIGEVSLAERDRLQTDLRDTLTGISLDFNSEIAAACRAMIAGTPEQIAERFAQWRRNQGRAQMFTRIALATAGRDTLNLALLTPSNDAFHPAPWPREWSAAQQRIRFSVFPRERGNRLFPYIPVNDDPLFEVPLLVAGSPPSFPQSGPAWLLYELNVPWSTRVLLPEILQRHLGPGASHYEVEVVAHTDKPKVIYQSRPGRFDQPPDASAGLFELRYDLIFRDVLPSQRQPRPPGPSRWQILVWQRDGSLEAAVARTRARNLAVTTGVLLLMLASVFALVRFTRRAQRLADLQMDFVAGVSHELRTPLTVIHTAAWNLRSRVATNPDQVQRYGELIQQESGRLKEMVEQVLRFVGTNAGRTIRETEPVSIQAVIDRALEASKTGIEAGHFRVEQHIEPELPLITGDATALKQAIENLLSNAVKYGANGTNWIGLTASRVHDRNDEGVELRVADHGPGIPADEQDLIFEPFFRGRRAISDQVHGTGLGLNLVKKIVEAHGGSIRVKSNPSHGTEFILRIPASGATAT